MTPPLSSILQLISVVWLSFMLGSPKSEGVHLTWVDSRCTGQLFQVESCYSTYQQDTCTEQKKMSLGDRSALLDTRILLNCSQQHQCYHSSILVGTHRTHVNTGHFHMCHLDSALAVVSPWYRSVLQCMGVHLDLTLSVQEDRSNLSHTVRRDS